MIYFVKNALNSSNSTVAYIVGMSQVGSNSVMGWNIRYLQSKFGMSCNQVMHTWNRLCMEDTEHKRVAEQIKELFLKN